MDVRLCNNPQESFSNNLDFAHLLSLVSKIHLRRINVRRMGRLGYYHVSPPIEVEPRDPRLLEGTRRLKGSP
jgi:hypothetical protein